MVILSFTVPSPLKSPRPLVGEERWLGTHWLIPDGRWEGKVGKVAAFLRKALEWQRHRITWWPSGDCGWNVKNMKWLVQIGQEKKEARKSSEPPKGGKENGDAALSLRHKLVFSRSY